jgi:hypothetical protein
MRKGGMLIKCIVAAVVAMLFFGWVTWLLWNWLVPTLFGGPSLSYWQALGLLLLTKILFFGIGGSRGCSEGYNTRQREWKRRFSEKVSAMTPEEREALKQKMREKWCGNTDKDAV